MIAWNQFSVLKLDSEFDLKWKATGSSFLTVKTLREAQSTISQYM